MKIIKNILPFFLFLIIIFIFILLLKNYKIESFENNKYTAIIIEPREHNALFYVLKNFLENLNNNWNIILFHGNLNKKYIENIINNNLKVYKNRIKLIDLKIDNLTAADYNNLLYNPKFYDNIPTETFLIFQTDSLINHRYKDKINDFLQYDYVGAPWVDGVGNGGLSLRKKSKMLEILNKDNIFTDENNKQLAEDVYFSLNKSTSIYKPDIELAKEFSSEHIWNKTSFGVHKPWCCHNREMMINDFPELEILMNLQ